MSVSHESRSNLWTDIKSCFGFVFFLFSLSVRATVLHMFSSGCMCSSVAIVLLSLSFFLSFSEVGFRVEDLDWIGHPVVIFVTTGLRKSKTPSLFTCLFLFFELSLTPAPAGLKTDHNEFS